MISVLKPTKILLAFYWSSKSSLVQNTINYFCDTGYYCVVFFKKKALKAHLSVTI